MFDKHCSGEARPDTVAAAPHLTVTASLQLSSSRDWFMIHISLLVTFKWIFITPRHVKISLDIIIFVVFELLRKISSGPALPIIAKKFKSIVAFYGIWGYRWSYQVQGLI